MTLIASDGYEYEDLTQRLLGNPIGNRRNDNIREVRRDFDAETAHTWIEAYDRAQGAHPTKCLTAWDAAYAYVARPN